MVRFVVEMRRSGRSGSDNTDNGALGDGAARSM